MTSTVYFGTFDWRFGAHVAPNTAPNVRQLAMKVFSSG